MSSTHRIFCWTALALAIGLVAGCGTAPTAPTTPNSSSPSSATVHARQDAGRASLVGDLLQTVTGLLWKTLRIVGSLGGSLANGLWRVDVPAGAISGTATITMGVPGATATGCQLEITPATSNHFAKPVTVTFDCRNVPAAELAGWSVYWFNPATGAWEKVQGSRVDAVRKTVSAPLWHFSKYGAGPSGGKAGW